MAAGMPMLTRQNSLETIMLIAGSSELDPDDSPSARANERSKASAAISARPKAA